MRTSGRGGRHQALADVLPALGLTAYPGAGSLSVRSLIITANICDTAITGSLGISTATDKHGILTGRTAA